MMVVMSVRVFDDGMRHDRSVTSPVESVYEFLNRVDDPFFSEVRDSITTWTGNYCAAERPDLIRRLRSGSDASFDGAYWELVLHELIRSSGSEVTCHPAVPGSRKTPDFFVDHPTPHYIEATLAADSMETPAAAKRRARIVEGLSRHLESPDFFINLNFFHEGAADPAVRRIVAKVQPWVRSLDWDAEHQRRSNGGSVLDSPATVWVADGWEIEFRPLPKKASARGDQRLSPIGMHGPSGGWVRDAYTLKQAVREKAGRYGKLPHAFVVAVRHLARGLDPHDIMSALFGNDVVRFRPDASHSPDRERDGALVGPSGPRNRRVSAVLVASGLLPWTASSAWLSLWHNPFANIPLTDLPGPWSHVRINAEGKIEEHTPDLPLPATLGLPTAWPTSQAALTSR